MNFCRARPYAISADNRPRATRGPAAVMMKRVPILRHFQRARKEPTNDAPAPLHKILRKLLIVISGSRTTFADQTRELSSTNCRCGLDAIEGTIVVVGSQQQLYTGLL
jgi:hypothetical protein